MAQRIVLNNDAAKHIQAYIDYNNMIGDHGGKLLSEKEAQDFMKNYKNKSKNRIYSSWKNEKNSECKMIGPASMCFCGHRFKDHEYLEPKNKKVFCKRPKCTCPCFSHIPVFGSNDFKCLCKHSYTEHDPISKRCVKGMCGCNRFFSAWSCSCGSKFGDHITIFETRDERIASGKPVDDLTRLNDDMNVPFNAGGLASFQSLVEGPERYEAYIDQLQDQQQKKSIAPPSNKRMIKDQKQTDIIQPENNDKRSRLKNLNDKISQDMKELGYDMMEVMPVQIQQQQQLQSNIVQSDWLVEKEPKTLLSLYQTPHIYAQVQIPLKNAKRLTR